MKSFIFGVLTTVFIGSLIANVILFDIAKPMDTISYSKEQQRLMDSLVASVD